MSLPAEELYCEEPQELAESDDEDQQSAALDHMRSMGDHAARSALHEAALRELYHQGERAIAAEAAAMRSAGQSEQAVAQWSVEARNNLRRASREQGEPIVDAVARSSRGAQDMPSYEQLRRRGRTDSQIVESASRSNARADRWVGRLRIAGRVFIAVDIGVASYNVASAPSVDRPRVMAREAGRLGGALAGGWGGAKGGAAAGAWGGPWGAGIGGALGGVGGAIAGGWAGGRAAEWAIEEFYPPADTDFERGS